MKKEKGVVMVKPGFLNSLGEVLKRLQAVDGVRIIKIVSFTVKETFFLDFYKDHKDKSFFGILKEYFVGKYVIIALFEGDSGVVERVRGIIGDTDPNKAVLGTIRHDLGGEKKDIMRNVVHSSANLPDGEREYALVCKELKI